MTRALGNKEKGGRVRGVGGRAKIKDVFGSGKSKQGGVVSVDELDTITKQITKKVREECSENLNEKFNEMMNVKLQGVFEYMRQIGVAVPDLSCTSVDRQDPSTPKNELGLSSSCNSVDRQDPLSNLKVFLFRCLLTSFSNCHLFNLFHNCNIFFFSNFPQCRMRRYVVYV